MIDVARRKLKDCVLLKMLYFFLSLFLSLDTPPMSPFTSSGLRCCVLLWGRLVGEPIDRRFELACLQVYTYVVSIVFPSSKVAWICNLRLGVF